MNFNEHCDGCKEYNHETHSCPRFNRVIETTVKDIQQRWIPCSERLPRCDENPVLVSSKEMVNIGWYSCGKWETGTRLPMKDVIAWQPLPEPYEGV